MAAKIASIHRVISTVRRTTAIVFSSVLRRPALAFDLITPVISRSNCKRAIARPGNPMAQGNRRGRIPQSRPSHSAQAISATTEKQKIGDYMETGGVSSTSPVAGFFFFSRSLFHRG